MKNEEGNDKQEQVLGTLHTSTQEIMRELGLNREETLQAKKELVPMGQKLTGLVGNMEDEVVIVRTRKSKTTQNRRYRMMIWPKQSLQKFLILGTLK